MRVLRSKKLIAVVAVALVAAATAAVGLTAVVSRTVLADGENLHYQVLKVVADNYDSGWLEHHGIVFVQVQEGSLQITSRGNCTPKTVAAGETYVKVPYVPVRGVSTGRVVFTATFLARYEEPLLIPVASACP